MKFLIMLIFLVGCSKPGDPEPIPESTLTNEDIANLQILREVTKDWAVMCKYTSEFGDVLEYPCFDDTDGDSLLWMGLLCLTDDSACEAIPFVQSENGKIWRSPTRKEIDTENSSSRDMLLGFLAYLVKTKDVESARKILNYIKGNQFKLCNDANNDRCNMNPAIYKNMWALMHEVWQYIGLKPDFYMKQASIAAMDLYPSAAKIVPTGFNMHLIAVEILLIQKVRANTGSVQAAATVLSGRQSENPFFQYLKVGRATEVAQQVINLCPPNQPEESTDWAWQRDTNERKWLKSSGHDCIFLINLLLE